MTEIPSHKFLTDTYDVALAKKLLIIAGPCGADPQEKDQNGKKIAWPTEELVEDFSAQLWTWASSISHLLVDAEDRVTRPMLKDVRKELRQLSTRTKTLLGSMVHLSVEARIRLSEQLRVDPGLVDTLELQEAEQMVSQNILQLGQLLLAVDLAAKNCFAPSIKDGEGTRHRNVRREATRELSFAWHILTRKRPTRRVHGLDHGDKGKSYGEFQDFVVVALEPLFGSKDASTGIDDVIRDAIATMGKTGASSCSHFFHI